MNQHISEPTMVVVTRQGDFWSMIGLAHPRVAGRETVDIQLGNLIIQMRPEHFRPLDLRHDIAYVALTK
jgi:hypothetical protein